MHPNSTASGRAAESLKNLKETILTKWVDRARVAVPATLDKDVYTVRDEIPRFLDELAKALSPSDPKKIATAENNLAEFHGQQRAGLTKYSLLQVLTEYGLLRMVLIDELQAAFPLTEKERNVIHLSIDSAVQIAGQEFADAEQAKLKLSLAIVEQSNRDLEHFAAIVAHDLKSPLGTIVGFTDLIDEELKNNPTLGVRKHMTFIRSAAQRMAELIDGVLSYASLNSSTQEFSLISCKDLVNSAVQNLKPAITAIAGSIECDELPDVLGSVPLLTQVFQNLISNSLKFHGDLPPVIQIRVASDGDFWRFCISDNGVGFDQKQSEKIFVLYKRLSEATLTPGAGIGLATCRRVIELHGGKIWAESGGGRGAKFFFTLAKISKPKASV